eukprot:5930308-Prymnesium_polylepis.1
MGRPNPTRNLLSPVQNPPTIEQHGDAYPACDGQVEPERICIPSVKVESRPVGGQRAHKMVKEKNKEDKGRYTSADADACLQRPTCGRAAFG